MEAVHVLIYCDLIAGSANQVLIYHGDDLNAPSAFASLRSCFDCRECYYTRADLCSLLF